MVLNGVGSAIVVHQGASTGGTDILAKLLQKFTGISFGSGLLIVDGLITLFAGMVYGIKPGMYALFGVLLNSLVIDQFLAGFNVKFNVTIVSKYYEEINNYILKLDRGSTIFKAQGGFSNEDKAVIMTVLDKSRYVQVKKFIKKIDPRAFVYVSIVHEVEGEGFTYYIEEEV